MRDEDVVKEIESDLDAIDGGGGDLAQDDLAAEGAEHNQSELDVDVDDTGTVTDKSIGGLEQVVHADAEADFLNYFVCILAVDVVFDGFGTWLLEILWGDLDEIGYGGQDEHFVGEQKEVR